MVWRPCRTTASPSARDATPRSSSNARNADTSRITAASASSCLAPEPYSIWSLSVADILKAAYFQTLSATVTVFHPACPLNHPSSAENTHEALLSSPRIASACAATEVSFRIANRVIAFFTPTYPLAPPDPSDQPHASNAS